VLANFSFCQVGAHSAQQCFSRQRSATWSLSEDFLGITRSSARASRAEGKKIWETPVNSQRAPLLRATLFCAILRRVIIIIISIQLLLFTPLPFTRYYTFPQDLANPSSLTDIVVGYPLDDLSSLFPPRRSEHYCGI